MKYGLIFIIAFLFFGCGQTEIKEIKNTFKNGQPEFIFYYLDKKDTLTYRKEAFYESGKRKYIGHLTHGIKEGVWTWWYENGIKKDQCNYVNGKEIDTIFHWYENGKLKRFDALQKGKASSDNPCTVCCNRKTTIFHENGKLKETFTMVDNRFQDTAKIWFENGQIESITVWKEGVQDGIFREYYSDGKMKTDAFFVDGWENGKVTQWDSLGKITKILYWKDRQIIKEE